MVLLPIFTYSSFRKCKETSLNSHCYFLFYLPTHLMYLTDCLQGTRVSNFLNSKNYLYNCSSLRNLGSRTKLTKTIERGDMFE